MAKQVSEPTALVTEYKESDSDETSEEGEIFPSGGCENKGETRPLPAEFDAASEGASEVCPSEADSFVQIATKVHRHDIDFPYFQNDELGEISIDKDNVFREMRNMVEKEILFFSDLRRRHPNLESFIETVLDRLRRRLEMYSVKSEESSAASDGLVKVEPMDGTPLPRISANSGEKPSPIQKTTARKKRTLTNVETTVSTKKVSKVNRDAPRGWRFLSRDSMSEDESASDGEVQDAAAKPATEMNGPSTYLTTPRRLFHPRNAYKYLKASFKTTRESERSESHDEGDPVKVLSTDEEVPSSEGCRAHSLDGSEAGENGSVESSSVSSTQRSSSMSDLLATPAKQIGKSLSSLKTEVSKWFSSAVKPGVS